MRRFVAIALSIGLVAFVSGGPVAAVDVNNFRISSYDIDYTLGRDSNNRSTLKTVEKITANFPDYDQNRGLERAIPKQYDGHSTDVQVESVVDETGKPRVFSTHSDSNGNLVVRMADMNVYVHGAQTYVLTYTQRDVTKFFTNTNADEFYWDTNGVGWQVPIDQLHVRLNLDASLQSKLNGNQRCYQGVVGSNNICDIAKNDQGFTASASSLDQGENLTIAVGFAPKTFTAYQMTMAETILMWWGIIQAAIFLPAMAVFVWVVRKLYMLRNRSRELGTIVPEYLPPQDASVTVAAHVAKGATKSVMTAQLIDLAVRRYIKLYEVKEKSLFSAGEYEIEIVRDINDLREEERELLSDMFAGSIQVGSRMNLKTLRNNTAYYKSTLDNDKKLRELVRGSYELYHHDDIATRWFRKMAIITLIVGFVLLSPLLLILAAAMIVCSFSTWSLTDKGLGLRRYLEGLKQYINVAEAERIKLLQSPEGAEKSGGINPNEPAKLVKLYEKTLPYAVLFGQEKQWNQQIGAYYEQAGGQPDWHTSHNGAFSALAFGSAMSGLSQAASYANSSDSSSGGSGGGGSSGGGGGGGGGGGV